MERSARSKAMIWKFFAALCIAATFAVVVTLIYAVADAQDDDGPLDVDVRETTQQDDDPGDVESVDDLPGDLSDSLAKNASPEAWMVWAGLILPWILAIVNRHQWGADLQTLAMVVVALLVALVGSYIRGELDNIEYAVAAVVALIVVVQVAYTVYSRLPGVGDLLRWLDDKTGGTPAGVAKVAALGVPPNRDDTTA